MVKASAYNAGDMGSIPGSGRSPGEGNGNPLQYSCLENQITHILQIIDTSTLPLNRCRSKEQAHMQP